MTTTQFLLFLSLTLSSGVGPHMACPCTQNPDCHAPRRAVCLHGSKHPRYVCLRRQLRFVEDVGAILATTRRSGSVDTVPPIPESSPTLESQIHSQKRRMLSPKAQIRCFFYREFDFDSLKWSCSEFGDGMGRLGDSGWGGDGTTGMGDSWPFSFLPDMTTVRVNLAYPSGRVRLAWTFSSGVVRGLAVSDARVRCRR